MNRLLLLAAGAAALSLTACERPATKVETREGGELRTITKLDCPEREGALRRVSASADGLTCAYEAGGAEVTLRLASLDGGDARAVLDPIESELKGLVPPPVRDAASDEGGKAEINFPGLHIKADEGGANVRIGNIKVDADEAGAEVRVGGETAANASGAFRSTYILASDKAGPGYQVVGYEARGPKAGPLVVAVVKAKGEDRNQHDLFDDMKDLVERNVGR